MKSPQESEGLFWLHVPFQTVRGTWLTAPSGGRLTVLGHPAELRNGPTIQQDSLASSTPMAIQQYLLFDPMPELEARSVFGELVARIPVLSLRQQLALTIPGVGLNDAPAVNGGTHSGSTPTLIPREFQPTPAWGAAQMKAYNDGASTLGPALDDCPAITDDRIRTAIDLIVASRYETLPRSVFLTQLTALDLLAVRHSRSVEICAWIDQKIAEGKKLGDAGILTALEHLKEESHGSAIRGLVSRAAGAMNKESEIADRQKIAGRLYGVRSGLSHAGKAGFRAEHVEQSRDLAHFVVDAATRFPEIIDG